MTDTVDRRGDNLLSLAEVRARTSLGRTTVYRKMADGTFPPKVQLSVKRVAWYQSDIDRFIANPMSYRA